MKNNYYIQARLFPTALSSVPLLIIVTKLLTPLFHQYFDNLYKGLPLIANTAISTALVFLLVQINRLIAKEIFQKIFFQDELNMPTTEYLLWNNNFFEKSIKAKIHNKIENMFGIHLLTEQEEQGEELRARKLITTSVSQMRNVLRNNEMILRHNIEYGFIRNLLGGSLLAFILSVGIMLYGIINGIGDLKMLGLFLSAMYSLPLLGSKFLIKRLGSYYSKILYEQFLTL